VLECVTLTEVVEFVVEVLVNLAAGTILHKKTAEDPESSHPHDLAKILAISISLSISKSNIASCCSLLMWKWHTLAYEHQQYPSVYQNHDVYQSVERLEGPGHAIESA